MMKRTLLLSLLLLLSALCVLSACTDGSEPGPDPTTDAPTTTDALTDTQPHAVTYSITEKYITAVNTLTATAGTFTDRLTADQLASAVTMGRTLTPDPLLYNLISIAGLTKDDLTLYSEMNGGLLDAAYIDALFLDPAVMRSTLRGEYTIMAGGYPYTVFDLANMSDEDRAALNIPAADLSAFLTTVAAAADTSGEQLGEDVLLFIEAYTVK